MNNKRPFLSLPYLIAVDCGTPTLRVSPKPAICLPVLVVEKRSMKEKPFDTGR